MATDSATVTMESLYTTIALSNGAIADPLRPPPNGGSICPQNTRTAVSAQRVIRYTSCLVLFRVGGSNGAISDFPVTSNPSWRQAALLDNFEWPYLRNGSFDPLM